ncbi:MAG TPA: DUF2255 family protein [Ktedonobacterales bacterium]|nr:DUF2255 family protein [Ktedonobacterales bacterium]
MSATVPKHFDEHVLNRLAQTEEIEIDVPRPEALASIHPTTIWVVVVDDTVYVRSWKGKAGRWYQRISADPQAVVYLEGHPIPVRATPVNDEATITQVSEAYRRKYFEDPFMRSMLRDEILPTTLRLEPA